MNSPLRKNQGIEFPDLVEKVSNLVHKMSGNKLGDKQAFMVETRVRRRMLELGMKTPADYFSYIDQNTEKESQVLVGLITTHHTFFFREFIHFETLKKMLPEFVKKAQLRPDKTIKIWSAACSRGHEVYSLAMFFEYYLPEIDPNIKYHILGTDIDPESVKIANNGVYLQSEIKEIPMNFLGNHWSKGTGEIAQYAKIKDTIRKKCEFKTGNLLEVEKTVPGRNFDIIFCRNVFIYFEPQQIEEISKKLLHTLNDDGLLFSGISESLTSYKLDFNCIGPSIYRKGLVNKTASLSTSTSNVISLSPSKIIKVLCVDDSSSILTLLKKILTKEHGFEVVQTAADGIKAEEYLKTNKVDIVTLDIHMPNMDGISYLAKNFNFKHPPVVMISSASREDSDTAMKALSLGASDYVEKPTLLNIEDKGDEIRTKLKSVMSFKIRPNSISSIDTELKKKIFISKPESKMRILFASIADIEKMKRFFNEMTSSEPGTIIFFEGQKDILENLIKTKMSDFKNKVQMYSDNVGEIKPGEIYLADFTSQFPNIILRYGSKKTSILVFGMTSKKVSDCILKWRNAQVLIEDCGAENNEKSSLKLKSQDCVPTTSFHYMSSVYLGGES